MLSFLCLCETNILHNVTICYIIINVRKLNNIRIGENKMLEHLMQAVEEYNEIVGEEQQLDWWEDVVSNYDINNEKEITQVYADLRCEIINLKRK